MFWTEEIPSLQEESEDWTKQQAPPLSLESFEGPSLFFWTDTRRGTAPRTMIVEQQLTQQSFQDLDSK